MDFRLFIFLISSVTLLVILSNTNAASTTNGKLLKFYPITKQQYNAILALTRDQAAVSEARVMESHRSLADWSKSLHTSWNNLFNFTTSTTNKTVYQNQKPSKQYPICVIKTKGSLRRRRGARQYNYDMDYAGLVPNVAFPGSSYYGRSLHQSTGRQYFGQYYPVPSQYYPVPADQIDNEGDVDNETEADPNVDSNNSETNNNESTSSVDETNNNSPIINCVVVVRRKNNSTSSSENTATEDSVEDHHHHSHEDGVDDNSNHHPHGLPPYPYPPQLSTYPYPPPIPPQAYYPYPYPAPPVSSLRSNQVSEIDPISAAHYQQMIAEYYRHLRALYMADASTGNTRSDDNAHYKNDEEYDDDEENIQSDEYDDDEYESS